MRRSLTWMSLLILCLLSPCGTLAETSVAIQYSGGQPNCTPENKCPDGLFYFNTYDCNNSPTWNNGSRSFLDPIQANISEFTSITVSVNGAYGCTDNSIIPTCGTLDGKLRLYLQNQFFGELDFPTQNCSCVNCVSSKPYISYSKSWPGYRFGGNNTFQVLANNASLCLSEIVLYITYVPLPSPTTTSTTSQPTTTSNSSTTVSTGTTINPTLGSSVLSTTSSEPTTAHESTTTGGETTATPTTGHDVTTGSETTTGGSGNHTSTTGDPSKTTSSSSSDSPQHNVVVVGAVMLSGMVFVNLCVVGGWYVLKRKPGEHDSEAGQHYDYAPIDANSLDKALVFTDILLGERIGRGSFGEVYLGTWFQTTVAVKKLPSEMLRNNASVLDEFNREIYLLRALRHPNVLQFLGSTHIPPNICLVTEYMPRGDLHKIIHDKAVNMDKNLIKHVAIDVSRGMLYLHSSIPVVIHRDLKSHNVLIGEHWNAKVADFGLCKIIQSWEETAKYTPCGTPKWAAPEVLRNETYTTKADVYSFAIILWEMTTRQDPFPGMSAFELIVQVGKHGLRPGALNDTNPLASLIAQCWDDNPKNRPNFERILTLLEAW